MRGRVLLHIAVAVALPSRHSTGPAHGGKEAHHQKVVPYKAAKAEGSASRDGKRALLENEVVGVSPKHNKKLDLPTTVEEQYKYWEVRVCPHASSSLQVG